MDGKMTRTDAERRLKSLFKFDKFYDDQWETISKLFNGERLLLIEKTGFGRYDNDLNQIHQVNMNSYWLSKIESFQNFYFPGLVVESKTSVIINGVAASYYGRSNVGATIREIGKYLTKLGATLIAPLVIAKTVGGDIA